MHYRICHHFSALFLATLLSGCLPAQLQKYKNQEHKLQPSAEVAESQTRPQSAPANAGTSPTQTQPTAPRATIYAVDGQTFRFALRDAEVWEAALTVLMRNYNPTIVDRSAGIISTEWDSFFLNGAAYRNKVSLRLVRYGPNLVDLSIHNNVERLRDASQAGGSIATVGAVWLHSSDPANEVARIVQNMAILLGQAPPVLPPNGALAHAGDLDSGTANR